MIDEYYVIKEGDLVIVRCNYALNCESNNDTHNLFGDQHKFIYNCYDELF